jgi:hypothetical protein
MGCMVQRDADMLADALAKQTVQCLSMFRSLGRRTRRIAKQLSMRKVGNLIVAVHLSVRRVACVRAFDNTYGIGKPRGLGSIV